MLQSKFVIELLFAIPVLVGVVFFMNQGWQQKAKAIQIVGDPSSIRPCRHALQDRRQLYGERDYQEFKGARCVGNNPVIRGVQDNEGTLCTNCHKFICACSSCICRH